MSRSYQIKISLGYTRKKICKHLPPLDNERIIVLENVDHRQCDSLEDYIVASDIKGINRIMSNGISLQGYKWKYDDKKDS